MSSTTKNEKIPRAIWNDSFTDSGGHGRHRSQCQTIKFSSKHLHWLTFIGKKNNAEFSQRKRRIKCKTGASEEKCEDEQLVVHWMTSFWENVVRGIRPLFLENKNTLAAFCVCFALCSAVPIVHGISVEHFELPPKWQKIVASAWTTKKGRKIQIQFSKEHTESEKKKKKKKKWK